MVSQTNCQSGPNVLRNRKASSTGSAARCASIVSAPPGAASGGGESLSGGGTSVLLAHARVALICAARPFIVYSTTGVMSGEACSARYFLISSQMGSKLSGAVGQLMPAMSPSGLDGMG